MNVGIFTKKEDGAIFGDLPTMQLRSVSLEPVEQKGKGPDYRATVEGAELGAAWKKTSKKGNAYLAFKVSIPGQAPVWLAISPTDTKGEYVAMWSEPKAAAAEPTDAGSDF